MKTNIGNLLSKKGPISQLLYDEIFAELRWRQIMATWESPRKNFILVEADNSVTHYNII